MKIMTVDKMMQNYNNRVPVKMALTIDTPAPLQWLLFSIIKEQITGWSIFFLTINKVNSI